MKNSNKPDKIMDISSQVRMTNTSIVDIESLVSDTNDINTAEKELKIMSKEKKTKK